MTDPTVVLPLDATGLQPSNKIEGESHSPAPAAKRLIIPRFGAFFKESLRVYDPNTGTDLTDAQYNCGDYWDEAGEASGKDVFFVIIVTDPAAPAELAIDYQAFGGPNSRNAIELVNWLALRRAETVGTKPWAELKDVPDKFKPKHHYHLLKHIYGLEYVIKAFTHVQDAIVVGSEAAWNEANKNIDNGLEMVRVNANFVVDEIVLAKFNEWKSGITLFQLGLDLMMNYPLANEVAGEAAGSDFAKPDINDDRYVNLKGLGMFAKSLVDRVVLSEVTHLGEEFAHIDEPQKGSIFGAHIGAIFALPSIDEAKNIIGYHINVYPTGYPTDNKFVITKLIANTAGLGCFLKGFNPVTGETYLGILPEPKCSTPVSWYRFFFHGEILDLQGLVEAHAKATSDPHDLTADQIGLNLVENLPVVTVDDIMARTGTRKYVTLDALMYHMRAYMEGATLPKGEDGKVDLDANPMNEAKIIFAPCKEGANAGYDSNGNKYPPKDQFVRSFCNGTDKWVTMTDGTGGTYDKMIQGDSDDCKYIDIPKEGTNLGEYCDGTDKKVKYADGKGSYTEQLIKANDPECGYIDPPKAGEQIAVFCSGVNQMVRYADGHGGYYDLPSMINTYLCGGTIYPSQTPSPTSPPTETPTPSGTGTPGPTPSGTPGPAASLEFISSHTTIPPGTSETLSVTLRGGAPNTTYNLDYWLRSATLPDQKTYTQQITTDKDGTGVKVIVSVNDGVLSGAFTCWTKIEQLNVKSNEIVRTFTQNSTTPTPSPTPTPTPSQTPARTMALVYTSSHTTITPGTTETITVSMTGGLPSRTYSVDLMLYSTALPAPQTRKGTTLTLTTNASGAAQGSVQSTDDGTIPRGVYQCWAFCAETNVSSPYFNRTFTGTPAPTPPQYNPKITYSTTHTTISPGTYETITASITGGVPNTVYGVEFWLYSSVLPAPQTRKGGTISVSTNANGTGSSSITSYDDGTLPRGTYESWCVIPSLNNLQSNHVNRTFIGTPAPTPPPYNPTTTYRSSHYTIYRGTTETIYVTISGMLPNTGYTVEAWFKTTADLSAYGLSPSWDGYTYFKATTLNMTTNSNGYAATQWSSTDDGSLPRGSYICWTLITETGTTSAAFTRVFV